MLSFEQTAKEEKAIEVAAHGKITHGTISEDPSSFEALIGEVGYQNVVILNLEDVDFVDSSGIGWLLQHHKRFRDAGGILVFHSLTPTVENVFRLLNLKQVFHVADDAVAARDITNWGK